MSIWILAFLLCAIFGVIGFFSGAIRITMMWIGMVLASMLTGAFAPKMTGLMPKIGIKHPLWIQMAPYIIVFALVALIIYGIGFAIHHKLAMIYKYSRDDYSRAKWEKMNRHVGLAVGLVIAVMMFFVVSKVAYVGGYLTAQLAEDKNNPFWINFLSDARADMQATGLDKAVAALDKTSPKFYDSADVLGLLYHNPALQSRLANYPYFLSTGQRPEFQELSADKEYNDLIFGRASFGNILNHPNTQRLLANQEIMAEVQGVDLKDFKTYLETGKSPKYAEEPILGRWILDKSAVLTHVRKTQPNMKAADLLAIKKGVESLPDITVINTLDNKAIIKAEGGGAPADPAAAGAAAEPAPAPGVDPRYARGMGNRPAPGAQRPPAAAPVAKPTPPPVLQIAGEGQWKRSPSGSYEMTIPDPAGKAQEIAASILEDELTMSKGGLSLVFYRAE